MDSNCSSTMTAPGEGKMRREVAWSFLSKFLALCSFMIINIVLARRLGPARFGEWSLFFSTVSILTCVSLFGVHMSVKTFVARYRGQPEVRSVLKSAFKIRVLLSLVVCIGGILLVDPLCRALGKDSFRVLYYASIPLVLGYGFVETAKAVFEGLHTIRFNFVTNCIESVGKLFLVLISLVLWGSFESIIASYGLAVCLTAIATSWMIYRYFYKPAPVCQHDYDRQILAYAMPMLVIYVCFSIGTEVDKVMVGLMSSDMELGYYANAKNLIAKVPHISGALSMGTMAVFARMDRSNKPELQRILRKILRVNMAFVCLFAFAALTAGWFVIPLVFGAGYAGSVAPVNYLLPYVLFAANSIILGQILDYQGLARKRAVALVIAVLLNVLLNWLLIPLWGARGAALATSVAYAPYFGLNVWEVRKLLWGDEGVCHEMVSD